jgi:hypothetical protein
MYEVTSIKESPVLKGHNFRVDMSKGLKIMSLGVINHGMSLSVLYLHCTYPLPNKQYFKGGLMIVILEIIGQCESSRT